MASRQDLDRSDLDSDSGPSESFQCQGPGTDSGPHAGGTGGLGVLVTPGLRHAAAGRGWLPETRCVTESESPAEAVESHF